MSAANLYLATTTPAAPEIAVFNGASTDAGDERTDNTGTQTRAGTNALKPRRRLRLSKKTAQPDINISPPKNCIKAWEKNWLILSVSLFRREIRSPDWLT